MDTNPEQDLIAVLAAQIQDDERILEGLGGGTLSLEDLERWHQRRWRSERSFMSESGRLIEGMKKKGLGRQMRSSRAQTFGQSARRARSVTSAGRRKRAAARKLLSAAGAPPQEAAKDGAATFTLCLGDLGLPCTLKLAGVYEDVLDAAVWHARHVHKLRGTPSSLRETLRSALIEDSTPRAAAFSRDGADRDERQVSDESANRTRSSGFASA